MRVLITGADGFIGKNLSLFLSERKDTLVVKYSRSNRLEDMPRLVEDVDFVFHLAGVNRPQDPTEFFSGNRDLTQALCRAVCSVADASGRRIPVLLSSSIQADRDNAYGQSKRGSEDAVFGIQNSHGIPVHVYRLPNVFGKWCKPNYNSAVATFCHNIARGLPIQIHDPAAPITLVYIDDVIEAFVHAMDAGLGNVDTTGFEKVAPEYFSTVGEVAGLIQSFHDSRQSLMTARVGNGLIRALYATYVSYLPPLAFNYSVPQYSDPRGVFVEMLKTPDCGQFSFFTAHPGITRGGHYHHSKTEKFLVIKGKARFRFRQMHSGERYELVTSGDKAEIVETVPGWTHDVTNIGDDEMIVMLWANETFDREKPDTYAYPV